MAEASLERELQCAICTDILYQPLTLLDCLHTFCGSCLKEWFAWQATSAASSRRHTLPYTCPSCREAVRGTKVDWRANTLLEGFLKANPERGKTEKEKEEMRKLYTPGDDVLKPVPQAADGDSEDERLLRQVRELSMVGNVSGSGGHRSERSSDRRRRQQAWDQGLSLTEGRLRQHDRDAPHAGQIEHQPSLRSLLSADDAGSRDIQAEILRSIYAEGVLEGIDLDNLTPEQEEELTDRIAAAYRRRQQQSPRERSGTREHRHPRASRSPQSGTSHSQPHEAGDATPPQPQTRSRPPVSRPHLFEQGLQEPSRRHGRSASSTSQRSHHSGSRNQPGTPAARSATDLSQQPSVNDAQRSRHTRGASTGRSVTDPADGVSREQLQRMRAESNSQRPSSSRGTQNADSLGENVSQAQAVANEVIASAQDRPPPVTLAATSQHAVRPAVSMAAFAPEPVVPLPSAPTMPSIKCARCGKADIQNDLHYNCSMCNVGNFNICLQCYRNERGCNYWFGFGFRAHDRWYRNAPQGGWPHGDELPHVLVPRRYVKDGQSPGVNNPETSPNAQLQQGAVCEICHSYANDCYWYCTAYCLEGAWGYCDNCVKQGRHCTHPLLLTAHVSSLQQPHHDPTKSTIVDLPHLAPGSYATLAPDTHCDICHRPIPPNSSRFHCYQCSEGDYDMCNECYRGLVAQGKISQANGPDGWRRCLQGHRMAIVGYSDRVEGGHLRHTISEMVGGWDFKDDEGTVQGHAALGGRIPPSGGVGMRCLALYNYFPPEGVSDELAFPRNAELREVKDIQNEDWYLGVYVGQVNLVPRNHVRMI